MTTSTGVSLVKAFIDSHRSEPGNNTGRANTGTLTPTQVLQALSGGSEPLTTSHLVALDNHARARAGQLQVVQAYLGPEIQAQESDATATVIRLISEDTGLSQAQVLDEFAAFYDGLVNRQVEATKQKFVDGVIKDLADLGITDLKGFRNDVLSALVGKVIKDHPDLKSKPLSTKYEDVTNPESHAFKTLVQETLGKVKEALKPRDNS